MPDTEDFAKKVREVVYKDLLGQTVNSFDIDKLAFLSAAITSSSYAARHMRSAKRFRHFLHLLDFAAERAKVEGLVLEFGVATGRSINHLATRFSSGTIFGFDSFHGLPEDWREGMTRGAFARAEPPTVATNVQLQIGLFDRTLPFFLDQHPDEPIAELVPVV